jgi:ABC-type glycerol-3-phosphate transport system substrate-binding protein
MSEPKRVDRRKFIYAGLGAVALIAIGAAAYVAMNPPVVTQTTTVPTTSVVTTTVPTTSVVTTTVSTTTSPTTSQTTTPTTSTTTTYKPTTIEFWSTFLGGGNNLPREQMLNMLVDILKNEQPWLKVELADKPYGEFPDRLLAACLAKNPPHVACSMWMWDPNFVPFFMEITDEMLEKIGVSKEDYEPVQWDINLWDGKLLGLNTQIDVMGLMWHKGLANEAGIDRPPETWEELADFSKKITDYFHNKGQTDVYGYNLCLRYNHGNTIFRFMPVVWAYGGSIMEITDGGEVKVTINSQGVIDAVNLYVRIYQKDKSCPPTAFDDTADQGNNYFMMNKVAYVIQHPASVDSILNQGFPLSKMGYDLYPKGPVRRAACMGGWNLHFFKDRIKTKEELEASLVFAKYFLSPELNAIWSKALGPGTKRALQTSIWQDEIKLKPWRRVQLEMIKYVIPFPRHPKWTEIALLVIPKMLQSACSGDMTTEQAVKWAEEQIKEKLKG